MQGWTQLAEGCYVHAGGMQEHTIEIVGVPHANMTGSNIIWLF
jgi:hypothetical protein